MHHFQINISFSAWILLSKKIAKYFPEIEDLGLPDMESQRISRDGYSVKGVPFMWDDGDGLQEWIIYKANRLGYSGIYMTPIEGPHKRKILQTAP